MAIPKQESRLFSGKQRSKTIDSIAWQVMLFILTHHLQLYILLLESKRSDPHKNYQAASQAFF
ncbi:MAG: hypothetical protein JWR72_1812 [Flavisolibacter sp.]|jgi:hypothetical protein|nr:hypothetical protein [Flavisolibacter sp.]